MLRAVALAFDQTIMTSRAASADLALSFMLRAVALAFDQTITRAVTQVARP